MKIADPHPLFQPFMSSRFPGGARPTLRMPGQVRECRVGQELGRGVASNSVPCPPHSLLWASLGPSPSSLVPWTPPHAHKVSSRLQLLFLGTRPFLKPPFECAVHIWECPSPLPYVSAQGTPAWEAPCRE